MDPSFGNGGIAVPAGIPGAAVDVRSFALQGDGKMVLAGVADFNTTGNRDFAVARVLPDGKPDLSFNGTGTAVTNLTIPPPGQTFSEDTASSVAVQSDGKVLVAGGAPDRFAVVRYQRDGRLDTRFGDKGIVRTPMGGPYWPEIWAMLLQPDGKVLAGGRSGGLTFNSVVLARYISPSFPEALQMEWPAGVMRKDGDLIHLGSVVRGSLQTISATLALRNTGSVPLTNLTASLSGADAPHFVITSPPGSTLNSGETTAFMVMFTPELFVSTLDADLVITADSPAPVEFAVTLRGSTALPVATLALEEAGSPVPSGGTVDFGTVPSGPGNTKLLTLRNTGNINLTVQEITLGGTGTPNDFTAGIPAESVLAGGESTTFPVTFSPLGTGIRTARLRIASTDTFNPPYEINLTGRSAAGMEAWRLTYFGSALNEGNGADLSDPDHDGITNLLEYATLTNPVRENGTAGMLVKNVSVLEYTILRPSGAAGLNYGLEWSDSLHPPWSTDGVTVSILSDNGTQQRVKFSAPAGDKRRFVRLKVTRM